MPINEVTRIDDARRRLAGIAKADIVVATSRRSAQDLDLSERRRMSPSSQFVHGGSRHQPAGRCG